MVNKEPLQRLKTQRHTEIKLKCVCGCVCVCDFTPVCCFTV